MKSNLIKDLKDNLTNIIFKDVRVYVGGNPKPFAIKLNGTLVYSKLEPLNGENGPKVEGEHYTRLIKNIKTFFL